MTTASPQPGPDILVSGRDEDARLSRRSVIALVAAAVIVLSGLAVWRLWPTPPPEFTLSDLQGVYAGMVRSDGTNDASVIDRDHVAEESGSVQPSACEPLFEATVLNRFPPAALDGVGTFWQLDRSAVSLFSYRFPDTAGAGREYARLSQALGACRDTRVELRGGPGGAGVLSGTRQDAAQLGYVLAADGGTKLAVHVLAFSNTISWQFRYEPVPGAYAPLTAQRVMDSLADQMRAVQDLHR